MESSKFCLLVSAVVALLTAAPGRVSSQEEVVCTDPFGYIAHRDCRFYYECISFVPNLRQCDSGLYFSPPLERCDFPQNVPECVGGTNRPIPTTPEMETTTEPPEELTSTTEEVTTPAPTTEPPEELTSTTEGPETEWPATEAPTTTPDPGPTIECPPDGTHNLPYPGNCSLYVACFNGDPYILDCSPLTFDKYDLTCKPASDAVCDEETPVQCPPTGYVTVPHGSSCDKYYACFEGDAFELECAANTYYDAAPAVEACNFPQVARCDSECPPSGIHYRPIRLRGCEWYKICFNGVSVNTECPDGEVYEPGQGGCVGVDAYTCPYV